MSSAKSIINLFLFLFRCCLIYFSSRHSSFPKICSILLENQTLKRNLELHGIKPYFLPYEKQVAHEVFSLSPKARRFFTLVSPRTALYAWKNFIARHHTYKHKRSGRPPITKAIKEMILQLKKENFTWGARRIRDELKKLSIFVSHETICKVLNHYRKIGDILPDLSWRKFISSHWKTLFACDFFTVTTFGMVTWYVFFIMKLENRKIVQWV